MIVPASKDKNGFVDIASAKDINAGTSLIAASSSPIEFKPKKIKPKPRIIYPVLLIFCFLPKQIIIAPTNTKYKTKLSISKEINNDVTVVPILAPITIPAACSKFIRPARTRPIVIAVEAELDCITIVIAIPINNALNGLVVYLSI